MQKQKDRKRDHHRKGLNCATCQLGFDGTRFSQYNKDFCSRHCLSDFQKALERELQQQQQNRTGAFQAQSDSGGVC
jgi:hypothetical protein